MGLDVSEDVLWHMAKHYLSDKDCMALIIAGVSGRFLQLRKRLDISHCYWLEPVTLCNIITQMTNLEELSIQDTQISLSHLPRIFEACKKIVRFSFTLRDTNLEQFKKDVAGKKDCLKQGFSRLTHLKIFTFTVPILSHGLEHLFSESWLILFEILGWCQDCVDLLMKFDCSFNPDAHKHIAIHKVIKTARKDLFIHLGWMKNLKSLILLGEGEDKILLYEFLYWLTDKQKEFSNALERLWYTDSFIKYDMPEMAELYGPHVKSLVLFADEDDESELKEYSELKEERYKQLEHVAGIIIQPFKHLSNLKYISGQCRVNDGELNEFCKEHPNLEQLHFDTVASVEGYRDSDVAIECFGEGKWELLSLKVLVYKCRKPSQKIIDHLVRACPNIEELHVNVEGPQETCDNVKFFNFFSAVQFQHLTRLTITGVKLHDGFYLPSIINKCPKLERLHLKQRSTGRISEFVHDLSECLPKAVKLRDLRLQWTHVCSEDVSYIKLLLDSLLKCSSHLERLVLADEEDKACSCGSNHNLHLQSDYLGTFVSKMERLVAFCLVGNRIDAGFAEKVKKELTDKILPKRPALYLYVGEELFEETNLDISAPRIHYDDMLYPVDPFDAPPPF